LLSKDLAKIINVGNWAAKAKNQESARPVPQVSELIQLPKDQTLKRLHLSDEKDGFVEFGTATSGWLGFYRSHKLRSMFPRLYASRVRALKLRVSSPVVFFNLTPVSFYPMVGIPGYYRTPGGVRHMPWFFTISDLGPEELADPDDQAYWSGYVSDSKFVKFIASAYDFIDEVVMREIFLNLAKVLPMQCPLTTSRFDFYPCAGRSPGCQKIAGPQDLPLQDCLARKLLESLR
jgi:hypothetical protein